MKALGTSDLLLKVAASCISGQGRAALKEASAGQSLRYDTGKTSLRGRSCNRREDLPMSTISQTQYSPVADGRSWATMEALLLTALALPGGAARQDSA